MTTIEQAPGGGMVRVLGGVLRRARRARQRREGSGWRQTDLARRTGVSVRTISRIEGGLQDQAYRETVERLANALHLPIDTVTTPYWCVAVDGHKVRRARLAAGLTQADLAARIDMTRRSLQYIESGQRPTPYRRTVERIADALGVAVDELTR